MAGALASNWLARVMVSSINAFECAVRTTQSGRACGQRQEKVRRSITLLPMSSSSTHLTVRPRPSPEVSTRWRCVDFGPYLRFASRPRLELLTHNNPKACFTLVLVCVETSPLELALHVAQMACFCQCQPAARMHSISAPNQPPVRPDLGQNLIGP